MVSLSLGYFIKDNDNHLLTSLYVKLPSTCWWSTSSWIWIYWTRIWDSYSRQEVLQTFGLAGFWFRPLGGEGGDSQLLPEVTAEEEIILPLTPSVHNPVSHTHFWSSRPWKASATFYHSYFWVRKQLSRQFSKIPNPLSRGTSSRSSRTPLTGPN